MASKRILLLVASIHGDTLGIQLARPSAHHHPFRSAATSIIAKRASVYGILDTVSLGSKACTPWVSYDPPLLAGKSQLLNP